MKLKNIFLSLVLSLLTLSNSFAMQPVGLTNGAGICYANAAIQMLFATPGLLNYLATKETETSNKLLGLYFSYEAGTPNNELKMEIIRDIMGENISVQNDFEFIEKLFIEIDPAKPLMDILENLGIVADVNENHIANIIHTGGHYYAEIKHNGQWYKANDNRITTIDGPTYANLNDQVKQVFCISLSNGMDINHFYDEDFETAKALSLSEQTSDHNSSDHNIDEDLERAIFLSLSDSTSDHNSDDEDLNPAIALSLSESENTNEEINKTQENITPQEKINRAKWIIQHEGIVSIDGLDEIDGLISEDEFNKLIETSKYLELEPNNLSEHGFNMLTEMLSRKM